MPVKSKTTRKLIDGVSKKRKTLVRAGKKLNKKNIQSGKKTVSHRLIKHNKIVKILGNKLLLSLFVFVVGILSVVGFFVWHASQGKVLGQGTGPNKIIPEVYTEPLVVSQGLKTLSITPNGGNKVKVRQEDIRYIYEKAYKNTDVIQFTYPYKIKEELVFYEPGHPTSFKYKLGNWESYKIEKDEEGNIIFYDKDEYDQNKVLARIFTIPTPFIEDKVGQRSFAAVETVVENGTLTITVDKNWLKTAQYPVVLDPTVEINVLNLYSHPQGGDDWVVEFKTEGKADLRIIPNDQATIDDDEFEGLYCGDEKLEPQILDGDVIYYPAWECDNIGKVIHHTIREGKHTLKFEFGTETAYAYNDPIESTQSMERMISSKPIDATYEWGTSPNMVAIDANTAYIFYIGSIFGYDTTFNVQDYRVMYQKTADGGVTWSEPTAFPAALYGAQWQSVAVWYDRWTAGDTGTKIHVVAAEAATDDIWYNYLDTATDSMNPIGWDIAGAGTAYTIASDGGVSVTKATDGRIYVAAATEQGTYDVQVYYSADGDTWTSTNFGASSFPSSGVAVGDYVQILPIGSDDVLLLMDDVSADEIISAVYNGSGWENEDRIDYWLEDASYDGPWSAAVNTSTNDVYLVGMTGFASSTADLAVYKYDGSSRDWTGLSNVATNTALTTVGTIVVDTATGNLHVLYNDCRSALQTDCVVQYKNSTNGGTTWSNPMQVTFLPDDVRYVRRSMGLVSNKLYFDYLDDDTDFMFTGVIDTTSVKSETTIDGVINDSTGDYNPSPNVVFVSADVGYIFYIDSLPALGDVVYRKTTDGGNSWGAPVNLSGATADVFANVAVWYDRWSPNDSTGNLIHIAAAENTEDDIWYSALDTSNDTQDADGWVAAIGTGTQYDLGSDGNVSISKSYNGTIYVSGCGTFDAATVCRVYYSTTGQNGSWTNTSFSPSYGLDDNDYGQLLPAQAGVMYIWQDTTTEDLRSYTYSDGAWGATKLLEGYFVDNGNFDASWSAVFDKATGDIFLIGMLGQGTASTTADVRGYKYSSSTASWSDSAVADPVENDPLVTVASVAMDASTGYLYAIYAKQNDSYTNLNSENMGIYYKVSTDGGTSWGSAIKLNSMDGDIRNIRNNGYNGERLYVNWFDEDFNILSGRSLIGGSASTIYEEGRNSWKPVSAAAEYSTSPNIVNIDANTAYVFYKGGNPWSANDYKIFYQKTTDGGDNWSQPVVLPGALYADQWNNLAVWYDRWTPGNTGTKIHIAAIDTVTDDVWYIYLDTSNDTLPATGWISAIATGSRFDVNADGGVTITVAGDGRIYVAGCGTFVVDSCPVYYSADGVTWSNTSYSPSAPYDLDDGDFVQLVPISNDDVLYIMHDTVANEVISSVYNGATWEDQEEIDYWVVNATYDAPWSAALKPSTGDVFLIGMSEIASTTGDLQAYKYASSTRNWTALSNVVTDTALIMDSSLTIDNTTGRLFAFYVECTSAIATDCLTRYKTSDDDGVTWSAPIEVSDTPDDYKVLKSTANAVADKIYFDYFNDDTSILYTNVISTSGVGRGVTIDATISDATREYNPGPNVVFTSAEIGYVFYLDGASPYNVVYRKTIDGGASWSAPTDLTGTSADVFDNVAVWYDRWSPNDNTGNLIHIVAVEETEDDLWYSALDTSNDTQDADGWVRVIDGAVYTAASDGNVSITKAGNGTIYVSGCGDFGGGACRVYYSATGQSGEWNDASFVAGGTLANGDFGQLLPAQAGIMYIWQDISANTWTGYVYSDGTWTTKTITGGSIVENGNYDTPWGATFDKNTGDIYLVGANAINSATGDIKAFKYSSSTADWSDSAVADLVTDDALVTGGAVSINPTNGYLYGIYFRQNNSTTRFSGQNMGVYARISKDGGETWSTAVKLNGFDHDVRSVRVNLANTERIYATWFFEDWNIMVGRTLDLFDTTIPAKAKIDSGVLKVHGAIMKINLLDPKLLKFDLSPGREG